MSYISDIIVARRVSGDMEDAAAAAKQTVIARAANEGVLAAATNPDDLSPREALELVYALRARIRMPRNG